jgi:pyruvate/2-oxoglutarate dehydrogenase complex dihydrolipoamide dehydrogenase (E3) component
MKKYTAVVIGSGPAGYTIDFGKVVARRDEVIRSSRQGVVHLLKQHGVDLYQGEAEVIAPGRVRIRQGKLDRDGKLMHYTGDAEELDADNIVLATGSQPLIPSFIDPNDPYVVSSNRLISIGHLPETLIIVGGGVIGLEFATIFSNLGSKVTVIEYLDRILASRSAANLPFSSRCLTTSGSRTPTKASRSTTICRPACPVSGPSVTPPASRSWPMSGCSRASSPPSI